MMTRLSASLGKETRLLLRDWHALLVLFAMPSLFVLIMSLALQGRFAEHGGAQLKGWLTISQSSSTTQAFADELALHPALAITPTNDTPPLSTADGLFHIHLLPSFDAALSGESEHRLGVSMLFAPELGMRDRSLISAAVQEAFAHFNTQLIAEDMGFDRDYARTELLKEGFIVAADEPLAERPNAVQQSVPAWLIFAMFFIAIPISTTLIQERQQKTLMRLQTFGIPLSLVYLAKLLPYFVINQLQLVVMLALGCLVLPLLGAEALSLDVSLGALALISTSVSIAALGFAALIAASARSIEQATVISGTMNILFAALGGIMIPRFIMPPLMQKLSLVSPMAWAQEGFLTVLIRGGSYGAVAVNSVVLIAMGCVLGALAIFMSRRRKNHD